MQRWVWVGSAAGMGVLELALLLPPCTPGLWLQVNGKWQSHEGVCRAVASRGRKRQAESVPAEGLGLGKGQLCR